MTITRESAQQGKVSAYSWVSDASQRSKRRQVHAACRKMIRNHHCLSIGITTARSRSLGQGVPDFMHRVPAAVCATDASHNRNEIEIPNRIESSRLQWCGQVGPRPTQWSACGTSEIIAEARSMHHHTRGTHTGRGVTRGRGSVTLTLTCRNVVLEDAGRHLAAVPPDFPCSCVACNIASASPENLPERLEEWAAGAIRVAKT